MPTPAQKQFKERVRGLQDKGYFTETVYSPTKRKRIKSIKWPSLIVVAIFLLSAIPSLYNQYTVSKHERMVTYLNKTFDQDKDSTKLINQISKVNTMSAIPTAKSNLYAILTEAKSTTAPRAFNEYNQRFLDVLQQKLLILTYIEITGKLHHYNSEELQPYFAELTHKQTNMREQLKRTFDKEDITYTEQPDGTITYWYKSYFGSEDSHISHKDK